MTGKRRKWDGPEEIVRKLRDADAMLNAGKDVAAVCQALEVSEATYLRWRKQYGGMKAEEAKSGGWRKAPGRREEAVEAAGSRTGVGHPDAQVHGGEELVSLPGSGFVIAIASLHLRLPRGPRWNFQLVFLERIARSLGIQRR
jgi:transposase-like protein